MKQARGFGEVDRYVAGIDLAGAADHYVCGPRKDDGPHDIEHFGTTTGDIARMVAWLKERNVTSAAMESTSVYWIPVYDALESAGIKPVLADTRQVHMVPGRKSDVQDCQWLQRLQSCGLIRGAFRPPERFNAIRTVIREKANVMAMRTQAIQAAQKSMGQMNIRLHHAISDITGKTGMAIVGAIVDGERDPPPGRGKPKDKADVSAKRDLARLLGGFDPTTLDGVDYALAAAIVAETGTDLSMFPNEAHFVSYAGLKPSLGKSAGKNVRTGRKAKNTSRLGQYFRQAAFTLTKSKCALGARYRCVRSRSCPTTAIKDVARELAKRYYRGVRYGQQYVDIGEESYLKRRREQMIRNMKRNITKLGVSAEELGFSVGYAGHLTEEFDGDWRFIVPLH